MIPFITKKCVDREPWAKTMNFYETNKEKKIRKYLKISRQDTRALNDVRYSVENYIVSEVLAMQILNDCLFLTDCIFI